MGIGDKVVVITDDFAGQKGLVGVIDRPVDSVGGWFWVKFDKRSAKEFGMKERDYKLEHLTYYSKLVKVLE